MGRAGAIRAGRAYVELFADGTFLTRDLRAAEASLRAFGTKVRDIGLALGAVGASVTAPILAAAKGFADSGAELYDMSQRTGLAIEELSRLSYAASQTGTSLSDVERSVRLMQKSISGAADSAEGTTGKLEDLGLSAADLGGIGVAAQFALISSRLREIRDPTERAAAAVKVFGRSGTAMLPLINEFQRLSAEAEELGLVRSAAAVKEGDALSDAYTRASKVVTSAWEAVGDAVSPTIRDFLDWTVKAVVGVRDWVKKNEDLIVSVLKIGAGLVAGGAALSALGLVFIGLSKAAGVAAGVLKVVIGLLAALISPLGLVVVALGGLAAAWATSSSEWQQSIARLQSGWSSLRDTATTAIGGIADALRAGDIPLAAEILWAGMRLAWAQGLAALKETWTRFKFDFLQDLADFTGGKGYRSLKNKMVISDIRDRAAAARESAYAKAGAPVRELEAARRNFEEYKKRFANPVVTEQYVKYIAKLEQQVAQAQVELEDVLKKLDKAEHEAIKAQTAEHTAGEREFEAGRRDKMDALKADRERELAAIRGDLSRAESGLTGILTRSAEDAFTAAKLAEWSAEAAAPPGGPEPIPLPFAKPEDQEGFLRRLEASMDRVQQATVTSVAGAFGGEAAWGLGAESAMRQQLDATRQVAANTKGLLDRASQPGGLVFA